METMSRSGQWLGLGGWLLLTFVAAAVGSIASMNAAEFYARLSRPPWAPPAWLFGPAWTVLYTAMAVAAWLVWRQGGFGHARAALVLFIAQLAVNALWSWVFFAWKRGALSFAVVLLLWVLIAATIVAFWRIDSLAGALMLPYLAWVSFASALNYSTWQRNPALL
jgi:tryptophan-rich sensory protein